MRDLLRAAKWEAAEPVPVPPTDIPRLANQPSHMAAGGQPTGVALAVRADTQEDFRLVRDRGANTPLNALHDALSQSGVLRVIIGPKP